MCESESPIQIDDHARWIQTDAITGYKVNRLDEFAIEEAMLLKEVYPGTNIDAITIGPDRSAKVIKPALIRKKQAGSIDRIKCRLHYRC